MHLGYPDLSSSTSMQSFGNADVINGKYSLNLMVQS